MYYWFFFLVLGRVYQDSIAPVVKIILLLLSILHSCIALVWWKVMYELSADLHCVYCLFSPNSFQVSLVSLLSISCMKSGRGFPTVWLCLVSHFPLDLSAFGLVFSCTASYIDIAPATFKTIILVSSAHIYSCNLEWFQFKVQLNFIYYVFVILFYSWCW
jgi:hypothetical protein